MDTSIPGLDSSDCLDVIGQQPNPIYTQICSCYSLSDATSHMSVIKTLTKGLERLSKSFPWVAGQVASETSLDSNTGIYKIQAFEESPRLIVKDYTNGSSMPTMLALRNGVFPFSMLDESVIAPRRTLPGSPEEAGLEMPVFAVQLNFIVGGLILTFVSHHQVMDMTGMGQIIHLLSKACRNEPFTEEQLHAGNFPRRNLYPLLDDSWSPGAELENQIVKSTAPDADGSAPPPPVQCSWIYIDFSAPSLAAIKDLGTKTLTSGYVSTDDALTAFIWQSVVRARASRLNPTDRPKLGRAIDARRYFDIPATYAGFMNNMVYHSFTIQEIIDEPLGVIASNLRKAVDPKTSTLKHDTMALATVLSRSKDKNIVSLAAHIDTSTDIMLSSWAKIDSYDLDFNFGLGKPESVRRPQFTPVEGLLYLLPKDPAGGIAVAICLRDEDLDQLRRDQVLMKYGSLIE